MSLGDWASISVIAVSVVTILGFIGRAIVRRLDHIDQCLDDARVESVAHTEKVRTELLTKEESIIADLTAHRQAREVRLDRIERYMAWIAGRLGLAQSDAPE